MCADSTCTNGRCVRLLILPLHDPDLNSLHADHAESSVQNQHHSLATIVPPPPQGPEYPTPFPCCWIVNAVPFVCPYGHWVSFRSPYHPMVTVQGTNGLSQGFQVHRLHPLGVSA